MKRGFGAAAAAAGACLALASLAACASVSDVDVKVGARQVTVKSTMYLTQDEADRFKAAAALEGFGSDVLGDLKTETVDGVEYLTGPGLSSIQTLQPSQLAENGIILDDDKMVMSGIDASSFADLGEGLADDSSLADMLGDMGYYCLAATFDKAPIDANGTIEGNTVTYTDPKQDMVYAAFTERATKASSVTSSVKNGAFTKKDSVTFSTPGIVSGYTVNGTATSPAAVIVGDELKVNTVAFSKQGAYTVGVRLTSGYVKTFSFTHDSKKPTANVKKGKTYKRGKKLVVKDAYGLKSIKLDGKKVRSGKKLKKRGKHTLKAVDRAGNVLTVKFKVK